MNRDVNLHGLRRVFETVVAVDAASFDVNSGELFGLVGPDGAGKTTLLRMLAGVLRPTSGDAMVAGASVTRDPEGVKARVAYMSQRFGLYQDLTVLENLEFYADLYLVPRSERPARLDRLFEFSRLGPFRNRLAGQLSGGMKQKLGLSCALIHQPEVLLLDEPTFGVDPISRRDLWIIVHEMVAQGMTAIVSTSYMDEAERFDRVALLDSGRVVRIGAPDELRRAAGGKLLSVTVADPYRALAIVSDLPDVERATLFGERIHVATAVPTEVVAALRAAGVRIIQVEEIAPSMEDVFMAVMG